MTQSQTNSIT